MSSIGGYFIKNMGKDVFPKFIFYLNLLKARGLEQYSGLDTIIDYITGYKYKDGEIILYEVIIWWTC